MKTRKTKKRNIIRRAVAFLLCMTMVLGLGMQDVIEQVYAEEAIPVIEQEAATEEAGELTTEGADPEENAETAEEPDERVEEAEEQSANSNPSQPADAEENTKTDVPSAPAENAGSEEGEKQNPSAPAEDGQSGSDSETSAETNPGGNTGNEITAPAEDGNTVTNPDETTGEDTEDDAAVSDEEEETTEPEEKVTELTYAAEDGSFSVTAAAVGEDTDLSSYELHAAQVQKDGEEADRYAAAEGLVAGALDAESRRIEELQAYDIWFTYTESGETADLSGQVQISLEYTAPEFPEGTDAQLEVFCLNGGAAEAVDGTDALAAGCELYALAWAVPAGYEKTWEDGQVIIRVTAEEGVLPAGAELSVTPIVKTEDMGSLTEEQQNAAEEINAQYDLTEKKLNEEVEENGETLGGFLAYDISFLVNGEKTEPNGNVSVTMEFKEAVLPEGVSEDARVSVKHLKEDAEAEDGIAVEDVSEKAEVQNTENAAVEKVMLSADSFSTYAITWAYPGSPSITDEVINEDSLLATWNGGGYVVGYNWYRSDSEKGDYQLVGKISYEGGVSNLSENGERLYPAYDQGARKWYKVEAVFEDGTKSSWSDAFQVPYYNELQNGDFETPANRKYNKYTGGYTPVTMTQVSNGEYKEEGIWQTTGTNNGKDIEILGAGEIIDWNETDGLSEYYAWQQGQQPAAAKGVQFAEINCEEAGALYQDVLTIPGTTLNYSLSHRARGNDKRNTEYDTMFLVIMPTEESQDLTTQEELEAKLAAYGVDVDKEYSTDHEAEKILYNQGGVLIMQITSDDQDWHHIDMETYTPTSSVTRFFFVSGSTDAERDGNRDDQGNPNGNTIGNFLDDVWFSQDLPPVADDEFTLEIKKEFEGLSQAEISTVRENIKFTISATDQEGKPLGDDQITNLFGTTVINGSDMEQSADGSLIWSVVNQKIDEGQIYSVTITESGAELDDSYTLNTTSQTSVKVGDADAVSQEGTDSATIELRGETVAEVTFTNTYTQSQTKKVNFTKIWDDYGNLYGTRPEELKVNLKGVITLEDGTEVDVPAEFIGLDEGALTLTERNAVSGEPNKWKTSWEVPVYYEHEGKQYPIEYSISEEELDTDYVYEASEANEADYNYVTKPTDDITSPDPVSAATTMSVSAMSASDSNTLGEPVHNKRITAYNETTGEYTLELDVSGAKGSATGVDVLFVIDKSGSMDDDGLLDDIQDLLTGGRRSPSEGIIDQIFEGDTAKVNSVAYVAFSDKDSWWGGTTVSDWYSASEKDTLESWINRIQANGDTNWTYAMQCASELLEAKANNNNKKVVIFLSDGAPNRTINSRGNERNANASQACSDAVAVVNGSEYLSSAMIYSVYMDSSAKGMMTSFANGIRGNHSNAIDGTGDALSTALEGILAQIIPAYKNVTITDTLSQFVEFAGADKSDIKVTKTLNGEPTDLDADLYEVTLAGNVITVDFSGELQDQATYTVSFQIKPSQDAIGYEGPFVTGEPGTGITAGKEGLPSNASATVQYDIVGVGEDYSAPYKMPVILVPAQKTTDITVEKVWKDNNDSAGVRPEEIVVELYQYAGDTKTLVGTEKLSDTNQWKHTWDEQPLINENGQTCTYGVEEINVPEGYVSSTASSSEDGGVKITVTNSYDPNSADVNICIANVLQTDTLTVEKEWSGDEDYLSGRPLSVKVKITDTTYNHAYTVDVESEDNWFTSIRVLKLKDVVYSATEIDLDSDYEMGTPSVRRVNDNNVTIELTNTLKKISIHIEKVWNEGGLSINHDPLTVNIKDSSGNVVKTATLSEETGWTATVGDLNAGDHYTVEEVNIPAGYVVSYDINEQTHKYTITNTLKWIAVKTNKAVTGESAKPLSGAVFELKDKNDNLIANGESDSSGEIGWELTDEAKEKEISLYTLDGEYKIIETKAPNGYKRNDSGWTVEFKAGVLVKFNDASLSVADVGEAGVSITLENEILYELPETGGPGIYLYMLGGVALMMAGTLLVYKKRKEEVLRS